MYDTSRRSDDFITVLRLTTETVAPSKLSLPIEDQQNWYDDALFYLKEAPPMKSMSAYDPPKPHGRLSYPNIIVMAHGTVSSTPRWSDRQGTDELAHDAGLYAVCGRMGIVK
jgi:hypothetical protein